MEDWCIGPLEELAGSFSGLEWNRAVSLAGRENEWFTPGQVEGAVTALRSEMLTPGKLTEWLAAYVKPDGGRPGTVGVVMAGNLPLVGFADLAAAIAVGHRAVVKPSSKDRVLMEYVVRELQRFGCKIELVPELKPEGLSGVIATGGDAARAVFGERFTGIPALLRGSRSSVAVLTGDETLTEMEGLGRDIFQYWGLGCRSVTRLLVPRGMDIVALAAILAGLVPDEVRLHAQYTACYRYARAMAVMGGVDWADGGAFILRRVSLGDDSLAVPALAEVLVSEYNDWEEVREWLSGHETWLQCAVGDFGCRVDFPRTVAFGRSQCPGWRDYADGVDTVEFLLGL